jgi:predicted nicotinamide N-methyase
MSAPEIAFTDGNSLVVSHGLELSQRESRVLGTTVWDSSKTLLSYLQTSPCRKSLQDASVLELGSGCGLAGLGVAMLGAKTVMLTDQNESDTLENLRGNLARNRHRLDAAAWLLGRPPCDVRVAELDWRKCDEDLRAAGLVDTAWDVIVGADVVYSLAAVEPLVKTICLLCNPSTVVWITNEDRSEAATAQFLAGLKDYFHIKRIAQSKLPEEARNPSLYTLQLKPRLDEAARLRWPVVGKGGFVVASQTWFEVAEA